MKRVHFGRAACTSVDHHIMEVMFPYFKDNFGNPSGLHDLKREVKQAVDDSSVKTADLIESQVEFIESGSATMFLNEEMSPLYTKGRKQ